MTDEVKAEVEHYMGFWLGCLGGSMGRGAMVSLGAHRGKLQNENSKDRNFMSTK